MNNLMHDTKESICSPICAYFVLENENCRDKNVVNGANFLIDLKVLYIERLQPS